MDTNMFCIGLVTSEERPVQVRCGTSKGRQDRLTESCSRYVKLSLDLKKERKCCCYQGWDMWKKLLLMTEFICLSVFNAN